MTVTLTAPAARPSAPHPLDDHAAVVFAVNLARAYRQVRAADEVPLPQAAHSTRALDCAATAVTDAFDDAWLAVKAAEDAGDLPAGLSTRMLVTWARIRRGGAL